MRARTFRQERMEARAAKWSHLGVEDPRPLAVHLHDQLLVHRHLSAKQQAHVVIIPIDPDPSAGRHAEDTEFGNRAGNRRRTRRSIMRAKSIPHGGTIAVKLLSITPFDNGS